MTGPTSFALILAEIACLQEAGTWRLDPPRLAGIEVVQDRIFEYRVQVANTGSEWLDVLDAVSSQGLVTARIEVARIAPGGYGGIFLRAEAGALPDTFEEEIVVRTNNAAMPERAFHISGRLVDPPPPEAAPVAAAPSPGAAGPAGGGVSSTGTLSSPGAADGSAGAPAVPSPAGLPAAPRPGRAPPTGEASPGLGAILILSFAAAAALLIFGTRLLLRRRST